MRTFTKMLTVVAVAGFLAAVSVPAEAKSRAERYKEWQEQQEQNKEVEKRGDVKPRPIPGVPEPSSALVFGAGLLVASQVARRRRGN